jgi:excinuclease ABC subunit A
LGKHQKATLQPYTGIFLQIREIFASTRGAKEKGYDISRFSFNNESGRCEKCLGEGYIKIDMHFLPDVFSLCSSCDGTRFNQETKQILWRGKNIADVLDMTVEEGCIFFSSNKKISAVLDVLKSVGLGYLKLGQSSLYFVGRRGPKNKISKRTGKIKSTTNAVHS